MYISIDGQYAVFKQYVAMENMERWKASLGKIQPLHSED